MSHTRTRTRTFMQNQAVASVANFGLKVGADSTVKLRAWSNMLTANMGSAVYIFEGTYSVAECQGRLSPAGSTSEIDGVLVPGSAVIEWEPSQDTREFTVFFNSTLVNLAVTIEIVERVNGQLI